jgi:rod shape-determining protein MreB
MEEVTVKADIGIDLGTSSILVYVKGKGVVVKEPSLVAFDRDSNTIKEIGEEARSLLGQSTGNIVPVRPLKKGVITDYTVTEKIIRYFVQKSLGKLIFKKPRINISVPCNITEVEKRAVIEAATAAGAREVTLIDEPMAAAIGAGVDIYKPSGSMVVDIGGGTTDIAVISLGGIVAHTSIKTAGNDFDNAIVKYMRDEYDVLIGDSLAENIKMKIGTASLNMLEETTEVQGRDIATGLPKKITLSSMEMARVLAEPISQIIEGIRVVLEDTEPELASDVLERGILLAGGGSLIRGLDKFIEEKTAIRTVLPEEPLLVVALGTGMYVKVE